MDSEEWEKVSDKTGSTAATSWSQVSEPWERVSVSSGVSSSCNTFPRSFADVVRSHNKPQRPPTNRHRLPPFAQHHRRQSQKQSDDKNESGSGELNSHLLDGETEFAAPASISRTEHGRGAHGNGHKMVRSQPHGHSGLELRKDTTITKVSRQHLPLHRSTFEQLMEPEPVTPLELMVGQRVDMPLSTNKKGRWKVASQLAHQADRVEFVKAHGHSLNKYVDGERGCLLDQTVVTLPSVGVIVPDKQHVKAAVEAAKRKQNRHKHSESDPNIVYKVDSKNGRIAKRVYDLRGVKPQLERSSRRLTPQSMVSNVPVTKGCSIKRAFVWKHGVNSCWRPVNNAPQNCRLDIDLGSECAVTGFSTLPRRPATHSYPTTDHVKSWGYRDLASYDGPVWQNVLPSSFELEAIEKYELLFRIGGGHDWVSIGVFEGHSSATQHEHLIGTERYHDLTNTQETDSRGVVCRHLRVRPLSATKPFSARFGVYGYSLNSKVNKKAALDSSAAKDQSEEGDSVRCVISSESETLNKKYTQQIWRSSSWDDVLARTVKKREVLAAGQL